ncbi:MAG: ATP-binding cassette domain-containing protein [Mesorhizobium sp.]|nr:MAG: ATP-binding cassette domain-containing protein [Mesorhizobium sp.]
MSAASATLEIRGVSRRFGKNTAVSAVDLSIPQGQMVGIIGRSGAGKSTLMKILGAVFADQADHLARPHLHGKAVQRHHAGIGLAHAVQAQERSDCGLSNGYVGIIHHA